MPREIRDALDIILAKFPLTDEDLTQLAEIERTARIGQLLFDAREAAGLTRGALARRVGVRASVIEDVEENDYQGDALDILERAANALNLRIDLMLVPIDTAQRPTRRVA